MYDPKNKGTAGGCGGIDKISRLQDAEMKEKEAEELAESVGALVEKILKLVLRDKKEDGKKDDSD